MLPLFHSCVGLVPDVYLVHDSYCCEGLSAGADYRFEIVAYSLLPLAPDAVEPVATVYTVDSSSDR